MKFYIIGDREIVLAFKLTGVDGTVAESRQEVLNAFNKVTSGNSGHSADADLPKVLILTEAAALTIEEEELAWQKTGKFPLIVEIPGLDGHVTGKKSLTDAIREAIGVQF